MAVEFFNLLEVPDFFCAEIYRPTTSRCILFDGENISFDASLFIYINSTNIHVIMIINRV